MQCIWVCVFSLFFFLMLLVCVTWLPEIVWVFRYSTREEKHSNNSSERHYIWKICMYVCIYLPEPDLSYNTKDLPSSGSLVIASGIFFFFLSSFFFSCCVWDLLPWPGMESGPPALGAQSHRNWTTREVREGITFLFFFIPNMSLIFPPDKNAIIENSKERHLVR